MKSYHDRLRQNIKHFYINSVFNGLIAIVAPIVIIFQLQSVGLSLTQVFIGEAIFAATILCMEIPSGILADKYGRRRCMVLAEILFAICFIVLAMSMSFTEVIIGQFLAGIAMAFASGANEALLYDSLKELGKQNYYKVYQSRFNTIGFTIAIFSSVISGVLATWFDLRFVMYIAAFFASLSVLNILLLSETKTKNLSKEIQFANHFKESIAYLKRHPVLWYVIGWGIVMGLTAKIGFQSLNPYWEIMEVPLYLFGIGLAIHNTIAAIVSHQAPLLFRYFGDRGMMCLLLGLALIAYALLGSLTVGIWWALLLPSCFQFHRALFVLIVNDALQQKAKSEHRATLLSLSSFARLGVQAVILPLFGFAAELWSLKTAFIFLAVFILFVGSLMLFGVNKYWVKHT